MERRRRCLDPWTAGLDTAVVARTPRQRSTSRSAARGRRRPEQDATQLWAWQDDPAAVVRARVFAARYEVVEGPVSFESRPWGNCARADRCFAPCCKGGGGTACDAHSVDERGRPVLVELRASAMDGRPFPQVRPKLAWLTFSRHPHTSVWSPAQRIGPRCGPRSHHGLRRVRSHMDRGGCDRQRVTDIGGRVAVDLE